MPRPEEEPAARPASAGQIVFAPPTGPSATLFADAAALAPLGTASPPPGWADPAAAFPAPPPGALPRARMPGADPTAVPPPVPADLTGAGQRIAVIDDGFSGAYDQSATAFDLDFSGANDGSAAVAREQTHGSWVAETALESAPGAEIVHLKVFPDEGESAALVDIEEALDWVVGNAAAFDISVVNLSLGFGNVAEPLPTILSDEIAALDAQDVAVVVAAGNEGAGQAPGVNVLAAEPASIGVSATDRSGDFAAFSQRHPELTDITAPGVGVEVEALDGTTRAVTGTSFAAPQVSGAIARLQEAAETVTGAPLSDEAALEFISEGATPLEAAGPDAPDGYAALDADAALALFLEAAEMDMLA